MKVKDFYEGLHCEVKLMVSSCVNGVTNNGSPYLNLTLQDNSKSIEAKLWDVKPEIKNQIVAGKVYSFELEINNYKNNLQAKVIKVIPVPSSEVNPADFSFVSPISQEELHSEVQKALNEITNTNIVKIVSTALNKYGEDFYQYPAASKIHHNFIGGLATHTAGMLRIARAVCDIYPEVSKDYLFGGIILHDIGKITELSSPILTEYTIDGKLLGHISIMDGILSEITKELNVQDSEEAKVLRHMVLSHHGEYEYGSPVLPMTVEAEILTYIDNMDSKINVLSKALSEVKEGEFTQKLFPLDNRQFYKHK